jgi:hypothetical protein
MTGAEVIAEVRDDAVRATMRMTLRTQDGAVHDVPNLRIRIARRARCGRC